MPDQESEDPRQRKDTPGFPLRWVFYAILVFALGYHLFALVQGG